MAELRALLDDHLARPFPSSVEKGTDYGGVDCVMIGADIYGWASRIADGERLPHDERVRFEAAAEGLRAALPAFPDAARSYYRELLDMSDLALLS